MRFLVSGEGPTDIGRCVQGDCCVADGFEAGPMAWLVDRVAESKLGYSTIECQFMHALTKAGLQAETKRLKPLSLRGKRRPEHETAYFFRNARALARAAMQLANELGEDVVAVLFRDADGTRSTRRGEWVAKWQSVMTGFELEGYALGVPMIPRPKSEAWLLCALKSNQPYRRCESIEEESGNDDAPNPLKAQLEQALGYKPSATEQAELVRNGTVDAMQIDMPSYSRFRDRLLEVVSA